MWLLDEMNTLNVAILGLGILRWTTELNVTCLNDLNQ
jgi:hypothetical protein